jgi:hypothetical protein
MNKNILIVLAFLAIAYAGCKDNAITPPPPSPPNSYFPETIGSNWKYRDSIYGEPTDTVHIFGVRVDTVTYTMNGATTNFNNDICYNVDVVSKLNGHSIAYFHVDKHVNALMESAVPYGLTNLQLLIDTASVGHTWGFSPTNNGVLNNSPVKAISTIVEKDTSKMVNGITYPNVMHTSINLQINVNGAGFHNIASYDFYLAKGFGLIEKDVKFYGLLNETKTLLNYNVK